MASLPLAPPHDFCCWTFTYEIFRDPVLAADNITYEREGVEEWFRTRYRTNQPLTSPKTGAPLDNDHLRPNYALKSAIQDWLKFRRCWHRGFLLRVEEPSFLQSTSSNKNVGCM